MHLYFSIPITARDGGSPPLSTTAIVVIEIGDINDSPPLFDTKSYFVTVEENIASKDALIFVRASDADSSPLNCNVSYNIENSRYGRYFSIQKSKTGEAVIHLRGKLFLIDPFNETFAASSVNYLPYFFSNLTKLFFIWKLKPKKA